MSKKCVDGLGVEGFTIFLCELGKLKCRMRHSYTSAGRRESIAEHSWRLAVMAMLVEDAFPDVGIGKVTRMALIHGWEGNYRRCACL